jgi:hypothetical protein
MARKDRLLAQAAEIQAKISTPQDDAAVDVSPVSEDNQGYASAQPDLSRAELDSLRAEIDRERQEKGRLARDYEESMREREQLLGGARQFESAAQDAARETAELKSQLARIREEQMAALTDADFEGIDPEVIPKLKNITEKQSRAIARTEMSLLRDELRAELKKELLGEVDSRQARSTFDSMLRANGDDDIYNVTKSEEFQSFVKEDELRVMAFANAANTRDDTSARVIKRLVKDFKEKAVKKPAQTPRTQSRVAPADAVSDDDNVQVDHVVLRRMLKGSPSERKKAMELLSQAEKRLSSKLRGGSAAYH